jgi:uncharacterized protein (DUF697 family)
MIMSENQEKAIKTVRRYVWWSMGAGLVPIPILDLVAVSGAQLKMLAELSKIYGVPFEESRVKSVIGALLGFIVPQSVTCGLVGSLIKVIPGVGLAGYPAMALFSGAAAWALGHVFIQHFESGGTFLDFKPETVEEYFRNKFQEGQKVAAAMRTEGKAEAEKAEPEKVEA